MRTATAAREPISDETKRAILADVGILAGYVDIVRGDTEEGYRGSAEVLYRGYPPARRNYGQVEARRLADEIYANEGRA